MGQDMARFLSQVEHWGDGSELAARQGSNPETWQTREWDEGEGGMRRDGDKGGETRVIGMWTGDSILLPCPITMILNYICVEFFRKCFACTCSSNSHMEIQTKNGIISVHRVRKPRLKEVKVFSESSSYWVERSVFKPLSLGSETVLILLSCNV